MSDQNPYAFGISGAAAADAPVAERAAFLQRTYSLLLLGVGVFAATMWAAGNIEPVRDMMMSLWTVVNRGWVGLIVYCGIFYGGAAAVHAFAERKQVNLVLYLGYAFVTGLLTAPIVLWAAAMDPGLVGQASLLTVLTFSGLTAYVFVTGKDFSFLRGILSMAFWVLLIAIIVGLIGGFSFGLWMSVAVIAFFIGYILYDTSRVLHHYRSTQHVAAACVLFVDVILLFRQILVLLIQLRDD